MMMLIKKIELSLFKFDIFKFSYLAKWQKILENNYANNLSVYKYCHWDRILTSK